MKHWKVAGMFCSPNHIMASSKSPQGIRKVHVRTATPGQLLVLKTTQPKSCNTQSRLSMPVGPYIAHVLSLSHPVWVMTVQQCWCSGQTCIEGKPPFATILE